MKQTKTNERKAGNEMETTQINHAEYQKRVRHYTVPMLQYTIKECQEAIEAMPNGHKAGYYADEIHYCAAEIRRRGL